ncbi:hypothetical protein KLMA_40181 [Kluyveromyces marxianus]|uniref:Protein CMG1 n=1 Tax=Kluyveromyces marxianus TaxID=4911 RepID=A0ABX6EYJ6_KLUMA|nr:protein CMG1 [Kluyveromyces marxianus]BAP71701.1 hypothetical protein KLMA_40181 [Kluyveromyces marxianus]
MKRSPLDVVDSTECASSDGDLSDGSSNNHHFKPQAFVKAKRQKTKLEESPVDSDCEDDYLTFEIEGEEDSTKLAKPVEDVPLSKLLPKGLKMMQSMGYKAGDDQKASGLIPIEIKTDRVGIKIKSHEKATGTGDLTNDNAETHFRERVAARNKMEHKQRILKQMQKIAFTLTGDVDLLSSTSDPRDFNVLWRDYAIELLKEITATDSSESESELAMPEDDELVMFHQLSTDEQIEKLNTFLRAELRYCFYCGSKYKNDEDLYSHCPGFTEEDHQ